MLYILFSVAWLMVINTYAMDKSDASRAAELVQAINERKREKHEHVAYLALSSPFPVHATREQFEEVRILCKPYYEPVLATALNNKVINANMFYVSGQSINAPRANLLFEAMEYAILSKETLDQRFASVVTLLKNGANPNEAGATYHDAQQERWGRRVCRAQLPLNFAQFTPELVKVLLEHRAEPKPEILCSMIYSCRYLDNESRVKICRSLQYLLHYGTDGLIDKFCHWSGQVSFPMGVAFSEDAKDIIKLFREHEHLKKESSNEIE